MQKKGFTLLELLIVIAILAILAATLIFILNPAETLKKSRDAQRLSDLAALKSAIGFYLTSTSTPYLAGGSSNAGCKSGVSYASGDIIYYSLPSDTPGGDITDSTLDGGSSAVPDAGQVTSANFKKIDATGWVPINLSSIAGGSPISNLPVDPVNEISNLGAVSATDLVYRYVCDVSDLTFEINANLESNTYTSNPDNREGNDGGNNTNLFEIGTKFTILGSGTDF